MASRTLENRERVEHTANRCGGKDEKPMSRLFHSLVFVFANITWVIMPAHADLCNSVQGGKNTSPLPVTGLEMSLYHDLFPNVATQGNDTWNQVIVQCNRQRDNKGNEVAAVTQTKDDNPSKKELRSPDLETKVIRGHYNFYGVLPFRQKYVYILSKSGGKWTMIIPYKPQINQLNGGSIDLGMGYRWIRSGVLDPPGTLGDGHAWRLYEASQVTTKDGVSTLIDGAKSIAETECNTTTFFPGHEHDYDGQNDTNSYKRDRKNHSIQLGKLQYRYGNDDNKDPVVEGCRVPDYTVVYWVPATPSSTLGTPGPLPHARRPGSSIGTPTPSPAPPPAPRGALVSATAQEFVLQNFQDVAQTYWTTPGVYELKLLMLGRNDQDFPKDTLALLRDDDHLTVNFATEFEAHNDREMYKANFWEPHGNFSTMTEDSTYGHEVGHAFGLDDEYGDHGLNNCADKAYKSFGTDIYKMCDKNAPAPPRTIYYYLATSRYITNQSECQTDPDCDKGEYCDAGVDLKKNACVPRKADGDACNVVGGGHQCTSGKCDLGHCYTPNSVSMGGSCYVDAACAQGKCSSAPGFGGTCVCKIDADCPQTPHKQWCNAGTDLTKNKCENLKADGASCDLVGGAHQCVGNACKFSKCYTPNSVSMGGSCFVDDACKVGKCSSADGFDGTCVCKVDADCPQTPHKQWCDAGLDTHRNACYAKLPSGASCGSAGTFGNDHKCQSGSCSGFPNYKCK
jgi:hypothetical protein